MEANDTPQKETINQNVTSISTQKYPATDMDAVFDSGIMTRKELIEHLEESLRDHNDGYYNEGEAIIPDEHYDSQVDFLKSIDPDNALLLEIGAYPRGEKITFKTPMKSIDKTDVVEHVIWLFDPEYISADFQGLSRDELLKKEILFSHKIDGIALKLHYGNGKLQWASTRGNGYVGGLVDLKRIAKIPDIPQSIPYDDELEINGEVFITKESFLLLQKENPEFTNARSLVTVTLLSDDPEVIAKRPLRFFTYGAINFPQHIVKEYALWEWIKTMGFTPIPHKIISVAEIKTVIDSTILMRDELPFYCDGMVFAENSIPEQAKYGETDKFQKFKIAYKYNTEAVLAEVSGVKWTSGRSGEIIPTVNVKPIEVDGLTVRNVFLHQYSYYELFDQPNTGDQIFITCRAGLMPVMQKMVKKVNTETASPSKCPICGTALKIKYPHLCCVNAKCPGKAARILEAHFKSRGIKGLGKKSVQKLVAAGIDSIDKFYDLTEETMVQHLKISMHHSKQILDSIANNSLANDAMLLASMQIHGIGIGTATHIFEKCGTLENLLALSREDSQALLRSVRGIGKDRVPDILSSMDGYMPVLRKMLSRMMRPDKVHSV